MKYYRKDKTSQVIILKQVGTWDIYRIDYFDFENGELAYRGYFVDNEIYLLNNGYTKEDIKREINDYSISIDRKYRNSEMFKTLKEAREWARTH